MVTVLTSCPASGRAGPAALHNPVERLVDALPFSEQLLENLPALWRQLVETLVAPAFLAPFAGEEILALETAQQGIQRALVDIETQIGERLAQRVAVVFRPQLRQH